MILPKQSQTTIGEILFKMFYLRTPEQKKAIMQSEDYLVFERAFGRDKLKEFYDRHVKHMEALNQKQDKRLPDE